MRVFTTEHDQQRDRGIAQHHHAWGGDQKVQIAEEIGNSDRKKPHRISTRAVNYYIITSHRNKCNLHTIELHNFKNFLRNQLLVKQLTKQQLQNYKPDRKSVV